jgi:hypothetical protein
MELQKSISVEKLDKDKPKQRVNRKRLGVYSVLTILGVLGIIAFGLYYLEENGNGILIVNSDAAVAKVTRFEPALDANIQTYQETQQIYAGDLNIVLDEYLDVEGVIKHSQTEALTIENVYSKKFTVQGKENYPFYLKKDKVAVEILGSSTNFLGLRGYITNIGGQSDPFRVTNDNRYVIDYAVSKNGEVLTVLEAELNNAERKDPVICRNCVDLLFDIYVTNYDLEGSVSQIENDQDFVPTVIKETKIDSVYVLVDEVWYKDVGDKDYIDLLNTNIDSVPAGGEDYEHLLGNELLNLKISVSPHGESFVYETFDMYVWNGESLQLMESGDSLGYSREDSGQISVDYMWLSEEIVTYPIQGENVVVDVDKLDRKLKDKNYEIYSFEPWDQEYFFYWGNISNEGDEMGLVDRHLRFAKSKVFVDSSREELSSIDGKFVVQSVDTINDRIFISSQDGSLHFLYEVESGTLTSL